MKEPIREKLAARAYEYDQMLGAAIAENEDRAYYAASSLLFVFLSECKTYDEANSLLNLTDVFIPVLGPAIEEARSILDQEKT